MLAFAMQAPNGFDLRSLNQPVAHASLRVATPCSQGGDEIVVCGRRHDSYRLPLPHQHAASRSADSSPSDLLRTESPVASMSPFLVGGGMVGFKVGTPTDHPGPQR